MQKGNPLVTVKLVSYSKISCIINQSKIVKDYTLWPKVSSTLPLEVINESPTKVCESQMKMSTL